jgi:DNA-binding HxlR family transcriptional regulator
MEAVNDIFTTITTLLAELRRLEAQLHDLRLSLSPDDAARLRHQEEPFWALNTLREKLQDQAGSILFTGISTLPPGQQVEWQREHRLTELLKVDWQDFASALSALGHPVRLGILQAMLRGQHATQELQQLPEMGTSGQLYHHLRELQISGWVRQVGRNNYVIQETRIIPLLTVLAAVIDDATDAPGDSAS